MIKEGSNSDSEPVELDKKVIWERTKAEVDEITDNLGRGVDGGIKEAVVAFMVNGFPLSSSCEGHAERAQPVPYIEVSAPNQPAERFVGQAEVFRKVAEKHGLKLEDVVRGINIDAFWEAMDESSKNEESAEYMEWDAKNKKLRTDTDDILKEFYEGKKVKPSIKLKTFEIAGGFRIHNGGKDYGDLIEDEGNVSEDRKKKRAVKLPVYKKEMDEFTAFLKDRFFNK